jgi:hypothetical protein
MKKSTLPSFAAQICLMLAFSALLSQNARAQESPKKTQFGIKASALYSSPVTVKSVPSQVTLGGYDARWGYDVSVFAQRKVWKNLSLLGQIGHSLQGRSWEGTAYNHNLAYAEIGANLYLLNPIFIEAGLRGGGVLASNDPFEDRMKKGDLGYRLGVGAKFSSHLSLHLDFLRSFTPFMETALPSGDFNIFRKNFTAGFSYTF